MSTMPAPCSLVQNRLGLGSQTEQYSDTPPGTRAQPEPGSRRIGKAEQPDQCGGQCRAGACTGTGSPHYAGGLVERSVRRRGIFLPGRV